MALCTIEFHGESIVKASGMKVIVPDRKGPWPVLYLLHGLSDDHTIWCRRTSIERYVEGTKLMVVMPDGHRSFYVNDPRPGGLAYEDHIAKDVVGFIDRTFPTVSSRAGRAVAGLSMGGYGALMLALRHPELFCAAASHSGAPAFARKHTKALRDVDALAGALPQGEYDCFALVERRLADGKLPTLRIDCGTDDPLLADNRAFHKHLQGLGVPHIYEEFPGGHDWGYWDEHIQQTLAFVLDRVKSVRRQRRRAPTRASASSARRPRERRSPPNRRRNK